MNQNNNFNTFLADKNKIPILVEYPQNLTLKPGDTAWFVCKTFDPHHRKVDWYFLNDKSPQEIETEDLFSYQKMSNTVSFVFIIETL